MTVFERTHAIFADEDVLRDDYQPERIEERDEELEEYKAYFQPVINGKQPRNIFLYGKTGVGKTVATKYLLSHLERDAERYDDLDITTVYLNCEHLTSSYRVAVNLVNELREDGEEISTTGYPRDAVYDMLWEELEAVGGTILVVLDEIDYIGDDDSLLYQIPRARSNENLHDAKVGIIGISNDFKFREQLDPRVEDTLCEREIHFPPYDGNELRNILEKRSDLAFRDGVLSEDVVPLCSALAAQDRGSARQALDLLFEAGDLARRRDDRRVTEEHVRDARSRLEKRQIEESMKDLTSHDHLTLYTITYLTVFGEEMPVRRQTIYDRYEEVAEATGHDPLAMRSLHAHLSDLVMLGILKRHERNEGRSGGAYYEYELGVAVDAVVTTLDGLAITQNLKTDRLRAAAERQGLLDPTDPT
ncbi:AAA family ATPase [Halarchaeum sp. CBA1220]|uniref:orc1/cdc6 family replication initiation protein n=1 Tax=Halarchaeum sp. CBA1220 TaxID=1853682 RepID=UPI000F3A8A71|nr:orc1/cdc6 family replication initiation protein [Halarchaeum sp. CBA1220]QLC34295.1 AAA family ATPase [Halarchaeum sp. CBA1220]